MHNTMNFKTISRMKVDELKGFSRLHGLKMNGSKEELVARVFVAIEHNENVVKSEEEVQLQIASEYQAKLMIEGKRFEDPLLMQDG